MNKIVALVGSSLFRDEYIRQIEREARKGNIAIGLTEIISKDRDLASRWGTEQASHVADESLIDQLHRFKLVCIAKADEVLVINVGGYIGDHTAAAIHYASQCNKPIRFFSDECVS